MKILFRVLTILVLATAIFGGAAVAIYELYLKPAELDKAEKRELANVVATPRPDYSLGEFDKAAGLQKEGRTDEAKAALWDFIQNFPESVKVPEAKKILGEINTERIFTPGDAPGKIMYQVARGDSLVKVAAKNSSNAELIYRSNNLDTIALSVGQPLYIPQLNTSIVVDRKAKTVTLFNDGEFLKEYAAESVKTPGMTGVTKTKVADKVALQGSTRVAFGDKRYTDSDRWVMLGQGVVIRGVPPAPAETPPAANTGPATPTPAGAAPQAAPEHKARVYPPGILVAPEDIEEIFLLVSRGTPVTIQ